MRELTTEIAETRWEDIGGLDEPKRLLKEALDWPLVYGARFKHAGASAPKGILLTGGSGTGKTLLAQAVGTTTEVNFIVARGPELLSKWVGESERGIREVFRRARQSAPSIIFFDEIDAITPTRGKGTGDGQIGDRMVGQFLLELDAIDDDSGVVVLAATNRPDLVDQALLRPGRFDLVIDLPAPDRAARLAILKVHCQHSPLSAEIDLAMLADKTDGMNGAEMAALCQRAKMLAIEASVEIEPDQIFKPFEIEPRHFENALTTIRRTQSHHASKKLENHAV
ncbi:ATP-binding protein [Rhizobium binxianense]